MTELKHGSASTYNNHKCRCDKCTKAWADYMRPRMKAYRAKDKKKGVSIKL